MQRQVMNVLAQIMGENTKIVYPDFITELITKYPEKKSQILYSYQQYPQIADVKNSWLYAKDCNILVGVNYRSDYTFFGKFYNQSIDKGIFGAWSAWSSGSVIGFWYIQENTLLCCGKGSNSYELSRTVIENPAEYKLSNGKFYYNNILVATDNNTILDVQMGIGQGGAKKARFDGNVNHFGILDENGKLLKYFVPTINGLLDIANCEFATFQYGNDFTFSDTPIFDTIIIDMGLRIIGTKVIGCENTISDIILPDYITTIDERAFDSNTFITSIDTSTAEGLSVIGNDAFSGCNLLSSVNICNTTTIGNRAFGNCSSLSELSLENVTNIGAFAFQNCSLLTEVEIPNSVQTIHQDAFRNDVLLKKVTIGSGVTNIGLHVNDWEDGKTFQNCPLEEIHFTSHTPPIIYGSNNFDGCSTTMKVYIPKGCLDVYKASQNYPNPSVYEYIEEEIEGLIPTIAINSDGFVTMQNGIDNSVIYYTIDGTEPSGGSIKYTEGFYVGNGVEIKAFASYNNNISSVSSKIYTDSDLIYQLAEPTVFDGTNYINTNAKLFDVDKPWTLIAEYKVTGVTAGYNKANIPAIDCMEPISPWTGIQLGWLNQSNGYKNNIIVDKNYIGTEALNKTIKTILIHTNGDNYEFHSWVDGVKDSLTYYTNTQSFYPHNYTTIIGAMWAGSDTDFTSVKKNMVGEVSKCKIWFKQRSIESLKADLGV